MADESDTESILSVRKLEMEGKREGLGEDVRLTGLPHTADVVAY